MKILHCRDAGFDCDAVVRGQTDEDIFAQVRPHAATAHQVAIGPDLEIQLRPLIHDET